MQKSQQQEVENNAKAFAKTLPDLLSKNLEGQYALMHDGKIEAILKDFHDAIIMGNKVFGNEPFSVQPIMREPVNLGSYSYK